MSVQLQFQALLEWIQNALNFINGSLGNVFSLVLDSVDLWAQAIPSFFVGVLDIVVIIKVIKGVREFL